MLPVEGLQLLHGHLLWQIQTDYLFWRHKTHHYDKDLTNIICLGIISLVWLTTFSGQLTLGARSWTSEAGRTCDGSEGWLGLGLSLAGAIEAGTVFDMALAVDVAAAAMGAEIVVVMVDVDPGGLSVLAASPSPSTRLPTVGCEGGGLFRPPLLLRLSSAPSGLERVLGRSSAIRSSPSAGPGSALSITHTLSLDQESANVFRTIEKKPYIIYCRKKALFRLKIYRYSFFIAYCMLHQNISQ